MKQYSILVVDDNPLVLKTLSTFLNGKGFSVTTVDSGEAAVETLSGKGFDLVITDLVMGQLDGIAVLKKAKELNPINMVILLTGYGDLSSAIDALRLGADDYLLKPCNLEEISFRVDNCLKKLETTRKIKIYESILPICCICGKIRDDEGRAPGSGDWLSIEKYLFQRGIRLSHSYCPACGRYKQKRNDSTNMSESP